MRISRLGGLSATQKEIVTLLKATRFANWQNLAFWLEITGVLNVSALKAALGYLQDRHEVLRTDYDIVSPPYEARVREDVSLPFRVISGASTNPDVLWQEVAGRRFNHSLAPLWEAVLLIRNDKHYSLFLCFDHLVTDGWGVRIWAKELAKAYNAFCRGTTPDLPEITHQTLDAVQAEDAYMHSDRGKRDLRWWLQHLSDPLAERCPLPGELPRQNIPYTRAGHTCITVSCQLRDRLDEASKRHRVTRYALVLAAFHGALEAHGAGPSPIVGTRVIGRDSTSSYSMGAFRTTVVIRPSFSANSSPTAAIARVQKSILATLGRQRIGFPALKTALAEHSGLRLDDLVLVMFLMEEPPFESLDFEGLAHVRERQTGAFAEAPEMHVTESRIAQYAPRIMRSNADLTLFALSRTESLELHIFFKVDRFATKQPSGFAETVVDKLEEVARSDSAGLGCIARAAPTEMAPSSFYTERDSIKFDRGILHMPAPDILSGAVSGDWLDNLLIIDLVHDERLMELDEDQYKFLKASVARKVATSPEIRKILTEAASEALEKAARIKTGE